MPNQSETSPRLAHDLAPDIEVAVVGAGPVGLMISNLLSIAGIRVTVLERNCGLFGLPRAIAATLRLFTQVGLFEQIAPGLIQNPPVRHLSARKVRLMAMDVPVRGLFGHSALGTFYQPDLEKVLLQGLSRFANVRVLLEHAVTGLHQNTGGIELNISTPQGERKLSANFAIGCDGGTSAVRDMLGARLVGSTYAERWLVVDAIVKNHDVSQITFHCDPRRPRVELPAVGERVRWEFMQLPGENEETLKRDDTIRALVMQHTKCRNFEIERKAVYTFHARVADHWRQGRVFLAGDAAHMMPPFRRPGYERWHARRRQSFVEACRGPTSTSAGRHPGHL
jgi:3-(3-hydroxy-phenyl)propionate hydroxylase